MTATDHQKTILLVEDDPVSRSVLTMTISKQYKLATAPSVTEAIAQLAAGGIDAIIADFVLLDGTALDLLDHMVRSRLDIPVIVISKFTEAKQINECWAKGAFDFLEKPVEKRQLLETLSHAFYLPSPYGRQSLNFTKRVMERDGRVLAVFRFDHLKKQFEGETALIDEVLVSAMAELDRFRQLFVEMMSHDPLQVSEKDLLFHAHRLESVSRSIYAEELASRCDMVQKALKAKETILHSDLQHILGATQRLATRIKLIQVHNLYRDRSHAS